MSTELYNDLIKLCQDDKEFTFRDTQSSQDGKTYRVFNYSLASRQQFNRPNALNCRGTMFRLEDGSNPVLVCLPQEKFFEHKKGELIITRTVYKADGSLISAYLDANGDVAFKSKNLPVAPKIVYAIYKEYDDTLKQEILQCLEARFSLDFEYVAPENRHIIKYDTSKLVLLRMRSHVNFQDIDLYTENSYPKLKTLLAPEFQEKNLDSLKHYRDVEGFVIKDEQGVYHKVKTYFYLAQEKLISIQDLSKFKERAVDVCLNGVVKEVCEKYLLKKRSPNYDAEGFIERVQYIDREVNTYRETFEQHCETVKQQNDIPSVMAYLKSHGLERAANIFVPLYKTGEFKDYNGAFKSLYLDSIQDLEGR